MRSPTLPSAFLAALVPVLALSCADGAPETVVTNQHEYDAGQKLDSSKPKDSSTDGAKGDSAGKSDADAGEAASEASTGSDSNSLCSAASCGGCCRTNGACAAGSEDDACGTGGASCADCAAKGTLCKANACMDCTPVCNGKLCGNANGCGSTCKTGSGCCDASCSGKSCGADNGCGSPCQQGSGCCTPTCNGKSCGEDNGCGSPCNPGSGCCNASCSGKSCGESDGCGGECSGSCPQWEKCEASGGSYECKCGAYPHYEVVKGVCLPSCGKYLDHFNLPNAGGGCCSTPCLGAGSGAGETRDCPYCCESTSGQPACS